MSRALSRILTVAMLTVGAAGAVHAQTEADATKRAWDAMKRADARVSLVLDTGDVVDYWSAFHTAYTGIDRDGIDRKLSQHLASWIAFAADSHRAWAQYRRSRAALQAQLDDLGPCPLDDVGASFAWGLRCGILSRQLSDLDASFKGQESTLKSRRKRLEEAEAALAVDLARRHGRSFE